MRSKFLQIKAQLAKISAEREKFLYFQVNKALQFFWESPVSQSVAKT